MKRFLIVASALATLAGPSLASAQDVGDRAQRHDDRVQYHEDRRHAARDGVVTPAEHREVRGDLRAVRQDNRDLRQDNRVAHWDRNNRNWWRGRPEFNGYAGRRAGFWYAPGYGYRAVDRRYWGYSWHRGGFVPYAYRSYYVRDPNFYGLRPAPYGYRWVYVDNNLVLMAIGTGLIADIVANAY